MNDSDRSEFYWKPATSRLQRYFPVLFLLCLILIGLGAPAESKDRVDEGDRNPIVRIGVLANRGQDMCLREWTPMADYLSAELAPKRFEIVPLDFDEVQTTVEQRNLDFMVTNPSMYVALEYRGLVYRIATFQQPSKDGGSPLPIYGGVIFCRADREDIRNLRDFIGKRFGAVEPSSLGGWHAALREFKRLGIQPQKDFAQLVFSGTHDAVVHAVRNGEVDGGTVRSTQLERMAAEGIIDLSELRIFACPSASTSDYPFFLSTRLYPEWPFAVVKGTELELGKSVAAALLRMDADDLAARACRGAGWAIPQDYASVHECLRELHLPPYESFGKVTLGQAIVQHWRFIFGMLAVSATMLVLGLMAWRASARLKCSVAALVMAKEEWERTFNAMPDLIAIIDTNHRIIRANRAMAERLGCTPAQCVGALCYNLMHCTDNPPELCPHTKLLQKGLPQAAEIYEPALDSFFYLTVTPLFDPEGRLFGSVHVASDITERKRSEQSLRESEETFRKLFEDSANPIILFDDKHIIDCNPATMKLFGYSKEEILSTTPWDLSPPTQPDGSSSSSKAEEMKILARQEESHQFEWNHRKADGSDLYVSVMLTPIVLCGRHVLHAALHDITKRRRAEQALKESESRFRSLFEYSPVAYQSLDESGCFLDVNTELCEMLGYSRENLMGKSFDELWAPDIRRLFPEKFAQFKERGHVNDELHLVHRDGTPTTVLLNGRIQYDINGRFERTHCVLFNISGRKLMEDMLRRSEERLALALRATNDALWDWDIVNDEIYYSARWWNMLGYEEKELDEDPDLWRRLVHPEDLDRADSVLKGALEEDMSFEVETRLLHKDGRYVPASMRGFILRDDRDRPVRVCGVNTDLTERKRAERERIQLEQQMQQAQKAESLNRMAGAIAHHFNNMLAATMGNLELALDDLPREAKPRKFIAEALKASSRAAEVSRFMLTYLGQTTGKKELLDLTEAGRETLTLLDASIPKNVHLKTELPPKGPVIRADGAHVKQILANLLSNAVDAIGEGEGFITLAIREIGATEIREPRLLPMGWKPQAKSYALLTVSDTGCGLDAATMGKIFDPFFSTKFTGRGMGLPTVLGLVRAHEGAITVDSRHGCGAIFQVFFPLREQQALVSSREDFSVPGSLEGCELVLVVDDESMVRNMAGTMLEKRLGYEVITACDGFEALDIFRSRKDEIDLVLLDLSMPGMNGWETLAGLRVLRPDIPVILTSGYDEAQAMRGEHPEQPQVFLHKPYGASDLRAAIAKTLRDASTVEDVKKSE